MYRTLSFCSILACIVKDLTSKPVVIMTKRVFLDFLPSSTALQQYLKLSVFIPFHRPLEIRFILTAIVCISFTAKAANQNLYKGDY